jgi:pyruvate dehydrogenase E1 component alpha subunit/2-oxoisovalerate dehydrogenase E1 component alpha subunit
MADKPTSKIRSGQNTGDIIEAFSEADEARATGLVRILDEKGQAKGAVPELPREELIRMFEGMVQSRLLDDMVGKLHRQGRVGTWFASRGQEAGVIAGAHAVDKQDYFLPGRRESYAAIYRGLSLRAFLAQILGNAHDVGHGRQAPGMGGSRTLRHVGGSSSVASHLPHATGLAWAARVSGDKTAVLSFMDEGATSQDDFQSGLNFAAVWKAPVVFVCQNGGEAPDMVVSRTVAIKGLAFGVPSVRVDGSDVFALYSVVKGALDLARAGRGPTFVEAVTCPVAEHQQDAAKFEALDPIRRFGLWLDAQKILDAQAQKTTQARLQAELHQALTAEETAGAPSSPSMFDDVLAEPGWMLEEQQAEYLRSRKRRAG